MTLEYKGNKAPVDASEEVKGLWEVYEVDGRSSYTEHIPKTVWESCAKDQCYFEITDSPKREATCKYCKRVVNFIVGIDRLENGKFTQVLKK